MSLQPTSSADPLVGLAPAIFGDAECDEMEAILDDIRTRLDETPQWEFCDGFMAALVCCRRAIPYDEYLSVLLDWDDNKDPNSDDLPQAAAPVFADIAQEDRFKVLWQQRWQEIVTALDNPVEDLGLPAAYGPIVLDVRGSVAQLPAEQRAAINAQETLPSYAQVWAIGFMFAVENWPHEWLPPRDKKLTKALDEAMGHLLDLTEDDTEPPMLDAQAVAIAGTRSDSEAVDDPPIHASQTRFDQFAMAIWAVYDLREIWRQVGPRVETVFNAAKLGRNEPCHCGSGKKFKHCHGA